MELMFVAVVDMIAVALTLQWAPESSRGLVKTLIAVPFCTAELLFQSVWRDI